MAGGLCTVAPFAVGFPVCCTVVPDVKTQGYVFIAAPGSTKIADAEITTYISEGLQIAIELEDYRGSIGGHCA